MSGKNKNIVLPIWSKNSRKGEKGKVLIVGGSEKYYGAPILTALGAECAGADLITLFLPSIYSNTARNYSLNFFIRNFYHDVVISYSDIEEIVMEARNNDALIIGNGIGQSKEALEAILAILQHINIPVVIDANALQSSILEIAESKQNSWVITPHVNEFKRLFGVEVSSEAVMVFAKQFNITICCKGPIDYVASNDAIYHNVTGVPQMRVGGSGDVLAGIIGSYIAQGLLPFDACKSAIYYYGLCGEQLVKKQYSITAQQLAQFYPTFLADIQKINHH